MPKPTFEMKSPDMKKLKKFFKKAPHLLKPVSANVLDSLAFKTKELDFKNLSATMTIRAESFIRSAIKVQMARKSTDIEKQKSFVYSIKKKGFTGFKEQEYGSTTQLRRSTTMASRGGNRRSKVKRKFRLLKKNKIFKPSQFNGKSLRQRYYFMMRILNQQGGGQFLISKPIPLKTGHLEPGFYDLKKTNITRVQKFDTPAQPRKTQWRSRSLQQLVKNNDIYKIWRSSLSHIIKKRGLKKA